MKLKAIRYQNGHLFVDDTKEPNDGVLSLLDGGMNRIFIDKAYPSQIRYSVMPMAVIAQSPELSIPDIPYVELEGIDLSVGSIDLDVVMHYEDSLEGMEFVLRPAGRFPFKYKKDGKMFYKVKAVNQ